MTRSEFKAYFARNSGLTSSQIDELGIRPVLCDCTMPDCQGWKMDKMETREELEQMVEKANEMRAENRRKEMN